MSICRHQLIPSVGISSFFCYKFWERSTFLPWLFRAQPSWFTVYQWIAEKGWLMAFLILLLHIGAFFRFCHLYALVGTNLQRWVVFLTFKRCCLLYRTRNWVPNGCASFFLFFSFKKNYVPLNRAGDTSSLWLTFQKTVMCTVVFTLEKSVLCISPSTWLIWPVLCISPSAWHIWPVLCISPSTWLVWPVMCISPSTWLVWPVLCISPSTLLICHVLCISPSTWLIWPVVCISPSTWLICPVLCISPSTWLICPVLCISPSTWLICPVLCISPSTWLSAFNLSHKISNSEPIGQDHWLLWLDTVCKIIFFKHVMQLLDHCGRMYSHDRLW